MALRVQTPPPFKDFFYPPQPFRDVEEKRPYIFWETRDTQVAEPIAKSEIEAIRAKIIAANFSSTEDTVLTLGKFHFQEIPPASRWTILSSAAKVLYAKSSLKSLALSIATVLLTAVVIAIFALELFAIGYIAILAWRKKAYPASIMLGLFGLSLFIRVITPTNLKSVEPCKTILQVQKAYAKKYVLLQELRSLPSSNHAATEENSNPITLEVIPIAEVKNPRILRVGPYTLDIREALRSIFARHTKFQKIRHPIESRTLQRGEANQFLTDVRRFFCIANRRELFQVWEEKLSREELQPLYRFVPWLQMEPGQRAEAKQQFEKEILSIRVAKKFMSLIPESTRTQYFGELQALQEPPKKNLTMAPSLYSLITAIRTQTDQQLVQYKELLGQLPSRLSCSRLGPLRMSFFGSSRPPTREDLRQTIDSHVSIYHNTKESESPFPISFIMYWSEQQVQERLAVYPNEPLETIRQEKKRADEELQRLARELADLDAIVIQMDFNETPLQIALRPLDQFLQHEALLLQTEPGAQPIAGFEEVKRMKKELEEDIARLKEVRECGLESVQKLNEHQLPARTRLVQISNALARLIPEE